MFLPLLRGGACNDAFTPLIPRLECLVNEFARYKPPEERTELQQFDAHKDLDPVMVHSDLSIRNLLVATDPPQITGVLDWEFAVAAPAEEELTFPATFESHGDGASVDDILGAFSGEGISVPPGSDTRTDHVMAYWHVLVSCHAAAWQDDPNFTDVDRQAAIDAAVAGVEEIFARHDC